MTDESNKKYYEEFKIPKVYEISSKIEEAVKQLEDVKVIHKNKANDIYKIIKIGGEFPTRGQILVEKNGENYDYVHISHIDGKAKEYKLKLEELTKENFAN